MAAAAILDLFDPEIVLFEPPSPKTAHKPNMKCIGSPVAEIRYGHSRILGTYGTPTLGGRGGRKGSAMAPFERAMAVSYRLSIVTVALSVTIRPQFAIECLRRSYQQGWVTFGQNFRVFPLA